MSSREPYGRDPLDRAPPQRPARYGARFPLATILRLALGSLIVGAIMQGLDITPRALLAFLGESLRLVRDLVEAAIGSGMEALLTLGRWLAYGAVIVVPLFLLSRVRR